MSDKKITDIILKYFNNNIKSILLSQDEEFIKKIYEIRVRVNNPIYVKTIDGNYFLGNKRRTTNYLTSIYHIKKRDIETIVGAITSYSLHAYENEIKKGFITIKGGHRVGISGECIYEKNAFKGFRNITSLNIRIARDFINCTNSYIKYIIKNSNEIYNTLIAGPPLSGKTTFLRDITRKLSNGTINPVFDGCDITVIDERGEIGAEFNGIPQIDIGQRTDILSNCMKRDGFTISIRSLSPKIIISDELGTIDDFEIIQYALKSGVKIISTAHCFSLEDLYENIYLNKILKNKFIDRIVLLNYDNKPVHVKKIYDNLKGVILYDSSD